MARLGLIVRLLVGALVNTLIVLALLTLAVVVLLWIVGRNKQLQARRQQRFSGVNASPSANGQAARLGTDPPTPFGSAVSPVQDVPPRRLSFSVGQGGPVLGLGPAPGGSVHGAPACAPPLHSTPMAGRRGAGIARSSGAGARATPASSSRRVSFLLTPEQERRVCTGGSLVDSGSGSDTVPSSPRVVVTRQAGQPAGVSKAAETQEDGVVAATSGLEPSADYEPMDTGGASPMPRSSLKGRKSGHTPRRASFGGEITRRPIRKTSSAGVLSSSAAATAADGAGPLPRRQLDPRLFQSVSVEFAPQKGRSTMERTLVQRASGGAARSGASGRLVDRGVLFEDSTDSRSGSGSGDGGRADSGDGGGADAGDDSDGVDQSFVYSSGPSPRLQVAGAGAPVAGSSNASPSRPTSGNTRERRMMGGSIQKPTTSSAFLAAIAAARHVRLLRGSPPGTMPVPLPRSLSSTGTNPDLAGATSPSTAAWERSRRTAAARVSRMLADADAAETAAAAIASQSEAHSRAAVAAEAAAASVRAQAAADETVLAAQNSAPPVTAKQTDPPVPGARSSGGGFVRAHSLTLPSGKDPGSGPGGSADGGLGGESFGGNGIDGGMGFASGRQGVAPSLKAEGAPGGEGAGVSIPASTSGVSVGLKRSPSQLALEGSGGSGVFLAGGALPPALVARAVAVAHSGLARRPAFLLHNP
ncbi:hypothetical protein MMPV_004416 [Pyropia vietnamensis]